MTPMIETIKYDVEGGIDFFKELKNISDTASTQATAASTEKRCLITDEILHPDAVTLTCGHSFNYIPLYKDVLFQKCSTLPKNISSKIVALYTKSNHMNVGYASSSIHNAPVQTMTYNSSLNLETMKLHYNEIKCPYCRAVTPNLLPYYPYPEVNQVKYVNSPSGLCLKGVSCEYYKMFPVKARSKSSGDGEIDKVCESSPVYNEQYGLLCRTHLKKATTVKPIKTKSENSIVSQIDPNTLPCEDTYNTNNTKCGFILLSGPRKGQHCGCNATKPAEIIAETAAYIPLCKRHQNK
jgi:hypothetical protein